jgi:hypothetical protein
MIAILSDVEHPKPIDLLLQRWISRMLIVQLSVGFSRAANSQRPKNSAEPGAGPSTTTHGAISSVIFFLLL